MFEKGHTKTGGRKKGTPNKTTAVRRELLNAIVDEEIEKIPGLLSQLDNPKDRLMVDIKLLEFAVPKLSSVELSEGSGASERLEALRRLAEGTED